MNNDIVNNIFLTFLLAFLGFNTGLYLSSIYNISVIIFLLLFVVIFNFLLTHYKIKEKLLNIIDIPFLKGIILFVLLFISVKYIDTDDFDMSFFIGGLFFMAIFYLLYDNEYIKYKLLQNKLKNENITNNNHR